MALCKILLEQMGRSAGDMVCGPGNGAQSTVIFTFDAGTGAFGSVGLLTGQVSEARLMENGVLQVEGSLERLQELLDLFDPMISPVKLTLR